MYKILLHVGKMSYISKKISHKKHKGGAQIYDLISAELNSQTKRFNFAEYGRATKMQLLTNNLNVNYGAIYENVAAQELKSTWR